jgi:hypothetical protein
MVHFWRDEDFRVELKGDQSEYEQDILHHLKIWLKLDKKAITIPALKQSQS